MRRLGDSAGFIAGFTIADLEYGSFINVRLIVYFYIGGISLLIGKKIFRNFFVVNLF